MVRGISWLGTLAFLATAAVVVAAPQLGLERYVITGGSMGDSLPRGSVAFEEVVPTSELETGDVITYQPPSESTESGLVTHRIQSIRRHAGALVLQTKGDANETADPWRFELSGSEQSRLAFSVPFVGYAIGALGDRTVRMALIGIPALLIGAGALRKLWRDSDAPTLADTAVEP